MNPEIASYLAWIFLGLIGLGVLFAAVYGMKTFFKQFQPQPFLSRDEQTALLRKEVKNLYKQQEVIAEESAVVAK
jgi:hypothetical protein